MKYKTGTFNLIPNKEYLKGKPAEMQSIYFWIVDHANKDGQCFPGRNTIAKESGCGVRTVDKYLKQLEEEGFLTKTLRHKKDSKELSSNMYQLLLIEDIEEVLPFLPPGLTQNDTTGLTQKSTVTIPNELYPLTTYKAPTVREGNLTQKEKKAQEQALKKTEKLRVRTELENSYTFNAEMEKLKVGAWKGDRIIYLYWLKKGVKFDNLLQFEIAKKKETRPASLLLGYNSDQVEKAIEYCEENYTKYPWNLWTVGKVIINVVNKHD